MTQPYVVLACVGALTVAALHAQEYAAVPPRSFAYVLQAEGIGKTRQAAASCLKDCGRDWVVIDPSYDGGSDGNWTGEELNTIRRGRAGRKVLAYLSIGEAENYRAYWRREWDANRDGKPDQKAPAWLCAENPEWKGNYRVKYWRMGQPESKV